MTDATRSDVAGLVRRAARPLDGTAASFDPLIERVGGCKFVLLGEASHGTHEFYRARAEITRRLIEERGFNAVAVEADWPDAYRVNRFVRGLDDDPDADAALGGFRRFPTWMWRNRDVLDFVAWLRRRNAALPPRGVKAGFYGLDLYSLFGSIASVIAYLARVDPDAARRALSLYSCFEQFREDPQAYGYRVGFGVTPSCEDEVVAQLEDLRRHALEYARRDGQVAEDEYFNAEQNARLVRDAERYYRALYRGRESTWNLRDRHMADTLDELAAHLGRHGVPTKVVVWAHNSHLGDARATEMGAGGELNIGQLVRERHGRDAALVGFTTHAGTVTAADNWDDPPRRMRVRPALPGSFERLFHDAGLARALLVFDDDAELAEALRRPRLERAIGVIYRPHSERVSHYFDARLSDQFDAVIHLDETRAVVPLDPAETWHHGEEAPETFPTGL